MLLCYAFTELELSEVYLYTEVDNTGAQMLFEKCGFRKGNLLKGSAFNRGVPVDRFYYAITAEEFMKYRELAWINRGGGKTP